jgi:hypothetical protein
LETNYYDSQNTNPNGFFVQTFCNIIAEQSNGRWSAWFRDVPNIAIAVIPAERPIFENRNSRMSLVYGASIYHANHNVHIRDTQGTVTKDIGSESLNWAVSRARVDLLRSDP